MAEGRALRSGALKEEMMSGPREVHGFAASGKGNTSDGVTPNHPPAQIGRSEPHARFNLRDPDFHLKSDSAKSFQKGTAHLGHQAGSIRSDCAPIRLESLGNAHT